ncbi:MAG: hypothetical protein J5I50_09210 [Chitinophagaceae bacterium]|nr:hypothetical protein [Chitinophagaceae bacterium]
MSELSVHEFEVQKNRKALLYTLIVCGSLLLIFFLYKWTAAEIPPQNTLDLIDINLGNEEEGMGEIQPLVPGDRAPDDQSVASAESSRRVEESPSRQIEADETGDIDAAPVVKPAKPNPKAPNVNKESTAKSSKTVNPSPVTNPNPAPPAPKSVYKGGSGTGGNNAEEDNGYRNQGYKGGTGDAGSPDGKPDAYGNTPGGRSGISVARGLSGRRMVAIPKMTGDFNENAKVYVDVVVDPSGKVTPQGIARGTTTSNTNIRNIAMQKARELKFNPTQSGGNETGTILFVFVLTN